MRTDPNLPEAVRNDGQKWRYDNSFDLVDRSKYRLSFSGGERDHLFISSQGKRFDDLYGVSGLDSPSDGRGFAILDFDRDGKSDIAVVNSNAPRLTLFHNEIPPISESGRSGDQVATSAPDSNFLAVRLVGGNRSATPSKQFSARDAYGAQVRVTVADSVLLREHRCGEGFAAQNSATMIVGLGSQARAKAIAVRWPSGGQTDLTDIPAGMLLTIYENAADSGNGEHVVMEPYVRPVQLANHRAGPVPGSQFKLAAVDGNDGPRISPGAPKLRMYTTMATWCPSCKKHLPQLALVRSAFEADSLEMYGLPVDPKDSPEMLAEYVARFHPAYRIVDSLSDADRTTLDAALAVDVKSDALPATIITNAAGQIIYASTGVATISDIRRLAERQQ